MVSKRESSTDDHPAIVAEHLKPKKGEVWWYRQGAYGVTAIVAAAIWFVMIGPKEFTPRSEMVDPATDVLKTGVKPTKDVKALSAELQFKIKAPDLRQLGGKLKTVGKSEFGGRPAAVMQYQFGKSEFLLYSFEQASLLFKDMRKVQTGKELFYLSSGGAVSVIAWKDRRSGYYAIAAKATEKDLVSLAGKMVKAF